MIVAERNRCVKYGLDASSIRLTYAYRIDTETARWLVEVADGDTVAAIADRHHISQPAVTRGLHRLATEVGVPLTEREGRRLRLTFAGELLVDAARGMLSELEGARRAIAEADDPARGIVRVGFLAPLGAWLVPELLAAYRTRRPGVRFELRNDGARAILAALASGSLDMLLTQAPVAETGLSFESLFDEELQLAIPASHRLTRRRAVSIAELAGEPWVLQPEGHGMRAHLEALCRQAGFTPWRAFESPDLATLFALIGAGSGVGLFAARPTTLSAHVRRLSLRPAAHRTVGLMLRREGTIPSAAGEFAAFVRERAAELGDPAIGAQRKS